LKCNAFGYRIDRRQFLQAAGVAAAGIGAIAAATGFVPGVLSEAAHTLHIRRADVEVGAGRIISTTTFDGRFPGPLLRSTVGRRMIIDVCNDTDQSEGIGWHGQESADAFAVPARSRRRFEFTPTLGGPSFYHSDVIAAADLGAGLYSGQAGPLLVEGREQRGGCDREVVLMLKEFAPGLRRTQQGCEVGYSVFTINGRMLGHGEPVRVRAGERVLFHVLNASATETRTLALPGHLFEVLGLEGSPVVSSAACVSALRVSPGESVSVVVAMDEPGIWILGEVSDEARVGGMGVVVEYAGRRGEARWVGRQRGADGAWRVRAAQSADLARRIDIVFARLPGGRGGFSRWTVNGEAFSLERREPLLRLRSGERYRFRMFNTSDALLPVRFQRHRLELASVAGRAAGGILKDVVAIEPGQRLEVEFVAGNVGPALLQSTGQLYRDFGLMARIDCV
jgi:FtsP/CotA-like multicopper oxidase with cupredoxin domain